MDKPRIVQQQDGLYKYVVYEDGDQRWWKIHRPGDETPDYYNEHDGDLIADLLSWLHKQRDKAEAECDSLRAEISRRQTRLDELEAENASLSATRPSESVRAWCEKLAHLVGEMPLELLQFDQRPMDWSQLAQAEEER